MQLHSISNIFSSINLIGGIITGTGKAEDDGLNSFSTGTLAIKDIENFSHCEGESIGISADIGVR